MAFYDHFPKGTSDEILSKLMSWQEEVLSEITSGMSAREAQKIRMSGALPLHMLPFEDQVRRMREFRTHIGLDQTLLGMAGTKDIDAGIDNIFGSMRVITPRGEKSPFLRFPHETSGNRVLDYIYRGLNINFDENNRPVRSGIFSADNATAASHFGVGVNSIPMITPDRLSMSSSIGAGKTYMAFDIETAGLLNNQIREVSYSLGTVGATGHTMSEGGQALFRPRLFARGTRGLKDNATGSVVSVGLEDFMGGKFGQTLAGLPTEKLGADFVEKMTPFLQKILDVDHVVGHNILGFDIPQIFQSLVGTDAYGSDSAFKSLVDNAYDAIQKKAIDTLVLARQAPNLAGLGTAAELLGTDSKSMYSIQNLLLETNLGELIGLDKIHAAMAGKGLHFAEVDNLVTMGLLEHLHELRPQRLGGSAVANSIRKQVLDSAAITPNTRIRSIDEITDATLRHIAQVDSGIEVGDTGRSAKRLRQLLEKARQGDQAAADEAVKLMRTGRVSDMRFDVNAIEQEVIETRNLALGIGTPIDSDSLIFGNNQFDQLVYGRTGRGVNYASGILGQRRVDKEVFAELQQTLAARGMPWAGASFEERSFGTVLSHLTSSLLPQHGVKSLISDTMISTFGGFDAGAISFTTATGRPTLPAHLLSEVGLLKDNDGTLLRLSTVGKTIKSDQETINLVFQFKSQADQEKLATALTHLAASDNPELIARTLGYNVSEADAVDIATRFRKAVNEDGLADVIRGMDPSRGVTIGQLVGQEAADVKQMLVNAVGESVLTDGKTMQYGLPYMRTHDNTVMTTGAVLDRHLLSSEAPHISSQVEQAARVLDKGYVPLGEAADKATLARLAVNMGEEATASAKKIYEGYQKIRPHLGKALLGTVGAGILYTVAKKHHENKIYNEPMREMPSMETRYASADFLQMQIDSGINKGYQRYDPLATAFTVRELDSNKINHTNMSIDKNNSLYGGVL